MTPERSRRMARQATRLLDLEHVQRRGWAMPWASVAMLRHDNCKPCRGRRLGRLAWEPDGTLWVETTQRAVYHRNDLDSGTPWAETAAGIVLHHMKGKQVRQQGDRFIVEGTHVARRTRGGLPAWVGSAPAEDADSLDDARDAGWLLVADPPINWGFPFVNAWTVCHKNWELGELGPSDRQRPNIDVARWFTGKSAKVHPPNT